MGIRLIVEVLDHAPAGLTPAERLVLLVIAESANDTTRQGWPGMEVLARRSGLAPDSVQKVFRRLAGRGIEVRMPVGADANGRPVFACRGRQTTYRLPPFRSSESPDRRPPNQAGKPGPSSAQSQEKGRTVVRERPDPGPLMGGSPSAPSPQEPSENPQQQRGATKDEKELVLAEIYRRKPDAPPGLIRHIYREDGPAILAEIRERADRQRLADWRASLLDMPPCRDGQPGGDKLRPDTGEPHCAICRARHRKAAA